MWLRRGRSLGSADREVKEIAAALGRSPASISRRVGNFAGTDNPGTGLKPISGEPLKIWLQVRDSPPQLAEAVRAARERLALLATSERNLNASTRTVRVVPPELPNMEPVQATTREQSKAATQVEAILREEFRSWRDPRGNRLQGLEMATPGSKLRADLYDPYVSLLIEVKAQTTRDYLRFAVGQLYDYRRYLSFPVELAVLVPTQPDDDLAGLLRSAAVGAIWPNAGSFRDSQDGHLLRTP
jgi:hypothetical protein